MKTKISKLFLAGFVATTAQAGQLQDQFMKLHSEIAQRAAAYENGQTTTTALSEGDLRQKLFASQSLAKLFTDRYGQLRDVELTTKGLEDQIGSYRKSMEQLSAAQSTGAPDAKIASLKSNRDSELLALESYIKARGWVSTKNGALTKMKAVFDGIKWASDSEEQRSAAALMGGHVKSIAQTQWDMNVLEGGRGIHDLRKQVRWYRLQMGVLSSFIGTHNKGCGNGAVLPAEHDAKGRCLVSSCLHDRMMQAYDFFGNIKDEGEAAEGLGGHLADGKFHEAKQYYTSLRSDQVFEKLSAELMSCAQ